MKSLLLIPFLSFSLLMSVISLDAKSLYSPGNDGTYLYQSTKLNFSVSIPADWQSKIKTEESDNGTTFSFIASPETVFLFSVNKISGEDWLKVKDQLTNVTVLRSDNGFVYYLEETGRKSIKGADAATYKSVVAGLDDVIHTIAWK